MAALNDLETLVAAAAPAPWRYQNNFGHLEIEGPPPRDSHFNAVAGHYGIREADAALIVAMRNHLTDLLAVARAAGVAQHLLEQAADTLHLDRGEETEGERKLRACAHRLRELLVR
jgi:hypothetical protein